MPPDPPREQGPPGLATPTQINATPTSKTVENPEMDWLFFLSRYPGRLHISPFSVSHSAAVEFRLGGTGASK